MTLHFLGGVLGGLWNVASNFLGGGTQTQPPPPPPPKPDYTPFIIGGVALLLVLVMFMKK